MPIGGVAFDLEGTIIDVEKAHHNKHLAAAAEFGLALTLEDALIMIPHFIGGPDEKVCEAIWGLLDPAIQEKVSVEQILVRDKLHYNRFLETIPIEPRPGFLDFYANVRALGIPMTIGSLTPQNQAETLLERSGLGNLFGDDNIVLREHVSNEKPAPDVYLLTAKIMGVDTRNQLVFEDSPHGVMAALAAGSKAVGMPTIIRPHTVAALIEAGACRIFYDWGEINVPVLIENLKKEP